ncbi:replication initiation and membrane attachment family protein [Halalkalibacter krulwichiae]|uniref:Replication initiation and membrane attachment protein n=1 Tax=Halalkalibacter krulwichiae TaxID=199441 RepID=A0A1X9ME50_9BACI|nr:replication initiation and membrane attachment family protein [Halalkalibacter krulwichiae]ARK31686.1 Replication initiation and membrane attachment protein [Halalkalibacter krulwichiae]
MTWHWKELLPVDRFTIRTSHYITDIDRLTLTLLYQPLIGAVAHSLYLTLVAQLEKDEYWSDEQTHRQLMLLLGAPLEVIFEERKKLEGIGLLRTFKRKEEDGETIYLYEIQPPMTPKQFFENDVLSVYLFNRLGKNQYRQLRDRFTLDQIETEEFTELTYGFDEVFASLHHSEMVSNLKSETGSALRVESGKQLLNSEHESFSFENQSFDFDLLEKSVSSFIVPTEVFTAEVKTLIGRLAFVYRIEPLEMASVVQQALIHDDKLDADELRRKVQEWYKIEHGNEPPSLGLQQHPAAYQTMQNQEPATEEERAIKFYETTPPLTLLEIRSGGGKVAAADAKIVESLLVDHQLLPGVVNVLLDFMLWSQDMKLSKALIDKVAGHWSRKKVKTVQEAMQLALHEQGKANQQSKKTNVAYNKKTTRSNHQPKRDKLPKWLLAEKEKDNQNQPNNETPPIDKKNNDAVTPGEMSFEEMLEKRRKNKEQRGEV